MKPKDLKDNRGVVQEGCELLIMIGFAWGRFMPDLSLHIPLKRRAVFTVLEAKGQIVHEERGGCSFLRKAPQAHTSQSNWKASPLREVIPMLKRGIHFYFSTQ